MGANSITSPRLTLPQAYSENNGLEKIKILNENALWNRVCRRK